MADYPPNYYAATFISNIRWPRLSGRDETDVCIVGGGLAGVTTALALAERGHSVTLLESHRIGWGASGRNGGFVSAGYPVPMTELAKRLGRGPALTLWQLSVEAVEKVRQHAERLGPEVLVGAGALVCRMVEYPDTLGRYVAAMNERFDAGLSFVPNAELRELLITERYADGYHDPRSLLVHPLNLVHGLAQEAAKLGARIHEGSQVRAFRRDGNCKSVSTDRGCVRARHIVLAGGAYLGPLHRRLSAALVPVASLVMTTKPIPEHIHTAIRTAAGISDSRLIPDYYRALPDGRLFWGGRGTAYPPSPERITRLLHDDMRRIYPQLADVEVEVAWSGLMSFARHRMPIVAPVADGLWIAAGFGGQGLATTMLAGDLVASAIADGDDRYRHFAPFTLPFVGGSLLGRPAFQLIAWASQLQQSVLRLRYRRRRTRLKLM